MPQCALSCHTQPWLTHALAQPSAPAILCWPAAAAAAPFYNLYNLLCPVQTPIKDSQAASKAILALEGVVDHGLFLDMVDVCIIAGGNGVEVKERKA